MAAKKKAKKKITAKKVQKRKVTPKKSALKRSSQGKSAQGKSAAKRAAKPVANVRKQVSKPPKKRMPPKRQRLDSAFSRSGRVNTSSSADSDSQGLSDVESVDSESVSELLDEGNTFEAGVVKGVEEADDSDGKEVHTREFPEDDVPEEYLDED
jgi:hypothetical protein